MVEIIGAEEEGIVGGIRNQVIDVCIRQGTSEWSYSMSMDEMAEHFSLV